WLSNAITRDARAPRAFDPRRCDSRKVKTASCRDQGKPEQSSSRVFPAPEATILLIVARLVAHRLEVGEMRERAFDGVPRGDLVDPGLDRRIFAGIDREQFEIAQPGPRRDVGDRVFAPGDVRVGGQSLLVEVEQLDDLRAVALGTVVMAGAGELAEMNVLPAHRPDIGNLQYEPLQRVVARNGLVRDELAGLFREIDQ